MRKHVGPSTVESPSAGLWPADSLPLSELATVFVTSEAPDHPVEHVFDGRRGPDATRWVAANPGEQTVLLAFDAPQPVQQVRIEIEEHERARTQEMDLAISTDGGRTFREIVRQEYTFSPPGTTVERESWTLRTDPVTHLRLRIKPDKSGGPALATMTSLTVS
jgi:hypothetical protein